MYCQAQHEDLLTLINADETVEIKQSKIDSFFTVHEKRISRKVLADCYHDVANKWYHEQWWESGEEAHILKAIALTKKAFELKLNEPHLEEGSLDKSSFNLGVFYYLKGDIYDAIDAYLFVVNNGTDTELIEDTKLELAALYIELGDFYKALNQLNQLISHFEMGKNSSDLNLIDTYILQAEAYSLMNLEEFSKQIQNSLHKADSLIQRAKDTDYSFQSLRVDQFAGNLLLKTKDYDHAIATHQKILKDTLNLYPEDLATVHNSIAYSQIKLKRHTAALANLNEAISLNDDYSSPFENLGDLYLAQKDFEKAMFNYQKAIVLIVDKEKEVNSDELFELEELELASDKLLLLNHIVTKANGWLKYHEFTKNENYLENALTTFERADQLVDIIRSESTEYQSKLFWREKGATLYTKAVEACYLLDKPKKAYYFMERNKALLLLEDISNERAKEIAKLPNALAKREFELKKAIFLAESDLRNFGTTSEDSIAVVKRNVYLNKRTYNTFVDSLTRAFPKYASTKKKVEVLPYSEFKKKYVSSNEIVLQYILNNEQGYGLLTTENENLFFKLDNLEQLNENIISLYGQLTGHISNQDEIKAYNTLSNEVFNALVPSRVYEKVKGKKLVLVTDHLLQQIPFEAFVSSVETTTYFIEETEIRYAYSMSYLEAKKRFVGDAPEALFGIAPVQFSELSLPDLMFSKSEIDAIALIFPGKVLLREEATKENFMKNLGTSRIIHLSTHADIGDNSDPWIAFSDEKLFLNEIYATKNQADMVVLSACNTSVGELKKGEGAISLARGFFYSGAKSVVSSLWSTYDKSSKELMTSFYEELNKGLTKSEALRNAKIDYINKYRGTMISPSYWAPLIVIGDNNPVTSSLFDSSLLAWIAVGLVLMLVNGFFFLKRKKNHSSS
ncbi:MAG: CHAT domain-containing protein [Maribacter sp.]